ncbi:hypothetical protein [Streptomyces sp. JJ38]|uniref:hypothetical protein n=1 Tax=Streptomyces sp. JJ38 TaxID=2738128 RepID=UPI001C59F907|nr:hypothetical protein [Streptomyces sp. JJ38]MBW1597425.1 hypothetical protein [Streptomyces sp. JJ38]
MKNVLGLLSFVLVAGGVTGLLHEWFGWFRLFGFLRFLSPDGYEVYTNLLLVVLGLALGAAGDRIGKRHA